MKSKSASATPYALALAGSACLSGHASAATVVTFYGPGAQTSTSTIPTPAGINIGISNFGGDPPKYNGKVDTAISADSGFAVGESAIFTQGTDIVATGMSPDGLYGYSSTPAPAPLDPRNGAILDGVTSNYANISFDGDDSVYEAVGEFVFDGMGGGYLVALAIDDAGEALPISTGAAAIEAVPEPSALALLALGSTGLLARRRRRAA